MSFKVEVQLTVVRCFFTTIKRISVDKMDGFLSIFVASVVPKRTISCFSYTKHASDTLILSPVNVAVVSPTPTSAAL